MFQAPDWGFRIHLWEKGILSFLLGSLYGWDSLNQPADMSTAVWVAMRAVKQDEGIESESSVRLGGPGLGWSL